MGRIGKRRTPLWARLGVAVGSLLLAPALVVGQATPGLSGPRTIAGPLNLLLVGIDPRDDHTAPLADSIVVAHVPADRHGIVLFSIPRDLVVTIPAFAKSGTPAQRSKINAAMGLGSRLGGDRYSAAQGYELLAQTVGEVTGIRRFDAGAVLNFGGFTRMVQAVGGLSMPIDQTVVSEHRKPDGTPRDRLAECPGHDNCHRPYIGPQKIYPKSDTPVHLEPWEALDFVRQRYGLPRSDYDRQRHQRQFLKALAKKMKRKILSTPDGLVRTTTAIGDSLTFIGGGHRLADWAAELKDLHLNAMTGVGLPGGPLFENGVYRGEQLSPAVTPFFTAVATDTVPQYLLSHPGVVTLDS
ncbi:anionic cell wall polymer biosynthesis LytR-Cps2A-Psr (LCP) family protein [Actinoplanes octamycinicus]|uniref:Anionic cell wall polymer biosynthesis LytR-Cps2A-Psr (LCP) family protein n=1 Tax=Actinoplanes octamycinicus TaxID=135948 RepID=A0A7W7H5S7_9ACTN|nr:LCP family protein [Actinoplanes octamycinicus]MBB4744413.1 anionic cell wall polymer biosynthesis LytR-Cps2A-Psr (LCP) family protein [Actinoplanes octamycinicus]